MNDATDPTDSPDSTDSTDSPGWTPEAKQRLLDRVAAWIDELDEPEPDPAGLAPEALAEAPAGEPDLLTLHAQLAALTQETRLLGRATSRLTTESKEAIEQLESRNTGGVAAETLARARREARMEQAAELLDVRDRLVRGIDQARARLAEIPPWRQRLLGGAGLLEALVRGNELALERLDDLLRRLSLHEVPSEGRAFDPSTMRAVETAVRDGVTPGTVLDVFRSGWLSGETVVRFAEVRVAAGSPPPNSGKR
ncbi:MAG: nucleotide exchange factor GrpE [Candidatus Rokubacteria bacterium]|nr:nucleotide exchange factor GrpE [Candidatus Rokubacteria bacterium]